MSLQVLCLTAISKILLSVHGETKVEQALQDIYLPQQLVCHLKRLVCQFKTKNVLQHTPIEAV